jgi:hypothetical protein
MRPDLDDLLSCVRENKYGYIGSGSGRHVFDLGNGYVIKAARNRKGYAQNKAEYRIAADSKSPLFAAIVQVSPDYGYLVMEKAKRAVSMDEVYRYFKVKDNKEFSRILELRKLCDTYDLVFADLRRASSWGWVNDRLVIIDYGFTLSVRSKYY